MSTRQIDGPPIPVNLSLCDQESLHLPEAIQPHGAMVAALADGLLVTHVSANLGRILGIAAESVLGRPLSAVIGDAASRMLQLSIPRDGTVFSHFMPLAGPNGGLLNLHAFRSGGHICIDIEPISAPGRGESAVTMAQSIIETFKLAGTRQDLCELAVRGLKELSGYDRVVAFRFDDDGACEVIAEARNDTIPSFLGLHFPASDVPRQVRLRFLSQPVSVIADADYHPVPMLTCPSLEAGRALDMTQSALRSVAASHLAYMRNMGTAASLAIGLIQGSEVWGFLVCHHIKPRIPGPELRALAVMLGQVTSLLLSSLGTAEILAQRLARGAALTRIADALAGPATLADALVSAETDLLSLVDASGVLVRVSGTTLRLGRTPEPAACDGLRKALLAEAGATVLAVDDLGRRHPNHEKEASGVLLVPLRSGPGDAILWFRPEVSRTVAWGGNPNDYVLADAATGRVLPRTSFATWTATIEGRSASWAEGDRALANELRTVVETAAAQRVKAELARLRHYDPLTGLANRSLLEEWLAEPGDAQGGAAALLFLDLDRFKLVNDSVGHAAGDAVLVETARRIVAAGGPDCRVARPGGNEFVVVSGVRDADAISELAERIRLAIAMPFQTTARSCHVSVSIGIALADTLDNLDLVRAADMAMYAAKQTGGNRSVMFEKSLHERVVRQFELDRDMREALDAGDQFVLAYQPLFAVAGGNKTLVGFEALLRWLHPRQGWLAPDLFIPLAEKSGLIVPLGDWVLKQALREGRSFQNAHSGRALHIAVNVAAPQLVRPGFTADLKAMLDAEGFPPSSLCLEVTETMLADVAVGFTLVEVRKLGVKVAIDDFDVGYSSLSYLCHLPADVAKLDRSFLENVDGNARGLEFVGAVISLVKATGKQVVVEGIETRAQFEIAIDAGADMFQGFWFARPMPAAGAAELARRPDVPV